MPLYPDSIERRLNEKLGELASILDFGARDGADSTAAIQNGLDAVATAGGGSLYIPKGTYLVKGELAIPAGITLWGEGESSILKRGGTLGAGKGLLGIAQPGIRLARFQIDGDVTASAGLLYGDFSYDPMHPLLTANTSVWVRAGTAGLICDQLTIRHTGGYAILLDADAGDILNVSILDCLFEQNRPHLFGLEADAKIYGAWTGGVFYRGDCRASENKLYAVRGLKVRGCTFRRMNGNCLWGHSYGFDTHHNGINFEGNSFEDIALDGILVGNVHGGVVKGNTFRRVGYTHQTDGDTPTPRLLPTRQATALDTSGFARGVEYAGNSFTSINGGAIDLDGFRDGVVSGNQVVQTEPGDPQYTEDQAGLYGPNRDGENWCKGINTGNSSLNGGSRNIAIVGNRFHNCGVNAIGLNFAKGCLVKGNHIVHLVTTGVPVQLYSTSGGDETYCYDNLVQGNTIEYTQANFAVIEAGDGWAAGHRNRVFDNEVRGGCLGEFKRAPESGSVTGFSIATNDHAVAAQSDSIVWREGSGTAAALKIGKRVAGALTQILQVNDQNYLLNVSAAGAAASGALTTGNRGSLAFYDAVATGKLVGDGFVALSDVTYAAADANLLPDTWGLIRYDRTAKRFQQSTAVSGGARVWKDLVAAPGGANTQVQFNDAGAFGGSASLTWNDAADGKLLTVTGRGAAYAAVAVAGGFVSSAYGFLAPAPTATNYNSIQAPAGGVQAACAVLAPTGTPTGGYLHFAPIGTETPIGLTGDTSLGTNADVFYSHVAAQGWKSLRFRVSGGAFAFDGQAPDGACGFKLGKFLSGNRTVNIDFHTDATYTDWSLRLIRNAGSNAESLLGHRGAGVLRLWAVESAVKIAAGSLSGNPVDVLQVYNTGVWVVGTSTSALQVRNEAGTAWGGCDALQYFARKVGYDALDASQMGAADCGGAHVGRLTMPEYTPGTRPSVPAGYGVILYDGGKFIANQGGAGWVDLIGSLSIGNTLAFGSRSVGDTAIEMGGSGSGNRYCYIDLVGDDTYTDYGLRLLRGNTGANADSNLTHRGSGTLAISAQDAGSIALNTGGSNRLTANSAGITVTALAATAAGNAITCSSGYVQAAGFASTSSAWNSIQTPGGMRASGAIIAGWTDSGSDPGLTSDILVYAKQPGSGVGVILAEGTYGNAGGFIGRTSNGAPGSRTGVTAEQVMLAFGGRGWYGTEGAGGGWSPSSQCTILFKATQLWSASARGSKIEFYTTPNDSTTNTLRMTVRETGQMVVAGTAGVDSIVLQNGYVNSAGGFYTGAAADNAIQAPSGGIWGNKLVSNTAVYLGTNPTNPSSGGGLAYLSGSQYRYWNGSSWQTVDFASSGLPADPQFASVRCSNTGTSLTFYNSNYNFQVNGNGDVSSAGVYNATAASGGFNAWGTLYNNIQASNGGVYAAGLCAGQYLALAGYYGIPGTLQGTPGTRARLYYDTSKAWVACEVRLYLPGVLCGANNIGCAGINIYSGGSGGNEAYAYTGRSVYMTALTGISLSHYALTFDSDGRCTSHAGQTIYPLSWVSHASEGLQFRGGVLTAS